MADKMNIEIWSDIMCPFCYIGKRKFEKALENFKDKDLINIEWKSYQLSPDMKTDSSKNLNQFLAAHKNISEVQAEEMNNQVSAFAADAGLTYNLQNAVPANTFNAHRLLHLAKKYNLQNEMEEALFKAYFTDGKNIDAAETLEFLSAQIGLPTAETMDLLSSDLYADEVYRDIYEARQIGVTGVPFFVFDNKQAISGAQDPAFFLEVLEKTFNSWKEN